MKGEGKEVKLKSGYGNPAALGKEFSFGELEGLKQVFSRIEKSNPKRNAKVDYWLSKNQSILGATWKEYMATEWDLLRGFADMEVIDGVEYLVHSGKDENDAMYFAGGNMYKKLDGKLTVTYNPFWEEAVEHTEENPTPAPKKNPYSIKFKTDTAQAEFDVALEGLRENYKAVVDLYRLPESFLENLNVVWQDIKQGADGKPFVESDATMFRSLLYDNAISF